MPRSAPERVSAAALSILHRDEDLLVIDKPAGLPTTSPDGRNCLTELAHELAPRAARVHASSRLDAEVTGIVTFALSDRAIHALLHARKHGRYMRTYVALASRSIEPAHGTWRWAIGIDPQDPRRRLALEEHSAHGKSATSSYVVAQSLAHAALIVLSPHTGRTHQLRVHAAQAGAPLYGDRHYGGPTHVTLADGTVVRARRVMLHCARVAFPVVNGVGELVLESPVPEDFRSMLRAFGGDERHLAPAALAAVAAG
jgi:23S rRNA-/tRNA-specific pseudouridylate synthase